MDGTRLILQCRSECGAKRFQLFPRHGRGQETVASFRSSVVLHYFTKLPSPIFPLPLCTQLVEAAAQAPAGDFDRAWGDWVAAAGEPEGPVLARLLDLLAEHCTRQPDPDAHAATVAAVFAPLCLKNRRGRAEAQGVRVLMDLLRARIHPPEPEPEPEPESALPTEQPVEGTEEEAGEEGDVAGTAHDGEVDEEGEAEAGQEEERPSTMEDVDEPLQGQGEEVELSATGDDGSGAAPQELTQTEEETQ
eukprot:gnl/Trimastix_PCT/2648.p1 GENE.gnl/Trimastix_PCT/2648~~gnl/Trimastix_PCT/2648.p1  ORF type:complete len:248 (+),score=31.26 gnl/Trimastix_PCT/2648:198-941(+)